MLRLNKDDFNDIWNWTNMLSRESSFQSFHTCFNKTQRNVSRAWELCHIFVHTKDMTNFSINFSNSNFHFNISSNLTCLWLEMLTMLCYERMYTLLMLTQTRQWFLWRVKFTSILKIFICTRSTKYCILLKYHCQFSYNFIISKVVQFIS